MASHWVRSALLTLLVCTSIFHPSIADDSSSTKWIRISNGDKESYLVKDSRRPSLYTGNFGDCLGSSLINVTRFDAAYYKDNATVLFHLTGNTALKSEALMMYIGVYAYGENRFDLTFNPCYANINSLCPMKAGVPIEASGIIPVTPEDVAGIPSIAFSIPDFEGEAILRIFANSTQEEIGCFSAVLTNGASFSQPESVGTILGIFTLVAVVASFATAVYGDSIPDMRKHYAHSLSVLVVFAVFHHIFFTGALSMNWPSVLVAFWSNYAWSGGMIHAEGMQNSINKFIGSNFGNTSMVGAAASGSPNRQLGGGYDISKIYRRTVPDLASLMKRSKFNRVSRQVEALLSKRELANSTNGPGWYGHAVRPGLPLPGNYSGFAGTLGQEEIAASNAFLTGFLWFLILIVIVGSAVVAFKWILEALSTAKLIKSDRLAFFRNHWLRYTTLAILRTLFIGFFMIMFLCLFQFTYRGAAGMIAIAAIVFVTLFVGMFAVAVYACFYRLKFGKYVSEPDQINLERTRKFKVIPWYRLSRASANQQDTSKVYAGFLPFWRISHISPEEQASVHNDEDYTKKFGWLASRFRRTRWWFFTAWLVYEFIRACFLAGASGHPMTQVFGLLVVEFVAFVAIIVTRPFEGQRLNTLVVYCLGFSKVTTVALSAAFDIRFNLARIPTTVIGVVIIVIQGILTIILMIAIAVGAATSYMSVMRNRPTEEFKPRSWRQPRERYFKHLDFAEKDIPRPPPAPKATPVPQDHKEYFSVTSVRRVAKIEDEDREFLAEVSADPHVSRTSLIPLGRMDGPSDVISPVTRPSRTASVHSQMSYTSLPFGARVHRASWSTREYEVWQEGERQRTANSQAPLWPEGDFKRGSASGSLAAGLPRNFSRESIGRTASPFASRPASRSVTPADMSRTGSAIGRARVRASDSTTNLTSRPQLTRVVSEDIAESTAKNETTEPGPAGGPR